MVINNEVSVFSLPVPNSPAVHYSFPVYSIRNSYHELFSQAQPERVPLSEDRADAAQNMAYSAWADRSKRAAVVSQHSVAGCRSASDELSRLVNQVVFNPVLWHTYKGRVENLQSIVKSDYCRNIR